MYLKHRNQKSKKIFIYKVKREKDWRNKDSKIYQYTRKRDPQELQSFRPLLQVCSIKVTAICNLLGLALWLSMWICFPGGPTHATSLRINMIGQGMCWSWLSWACPQCTPVGLVNWPLFTFLRQLYRPYRELIIYNALVSHTNLAKPRALVVGQSSVTVVQVSGYTEISTFDKLIPQ